MTLEAKLLEMMWSGHGARRSAEVENVIRHEEFKKSREQVSIAWSTLTMAEAEKYKAVNRVLDLNG